MSYGSIYIKVYYYLKYFDQRYVVKNCKGNDWLCFNVVCLFEYNFQNLRRILFALNCFTYFIGIFLMSIFIKNIKLNT